MSHVTFQVLEGLERGEVFHDLPTPVTIGREEDNHVRLNDERVSRFHAKVQEDEGRIILTDLESTNGTRVNGHAVKMRVLQIGDQLQIGRCLLLYGSPQQIEARIKDGGARWAGGDQTMTSESGSGADIESGSGSVDVDQFEDPFPHGPPELPQNLSGVHTAQLSDMLAFFHSRVLRILLELEELPDLPADATTRMALPDVAWHELQELEMQISAYMRGVADPGRE
ncbi:MAG: FHA domain-containing protein [Planctomycetaceae bacterium]|nr:FHA domain-containing protein [Planctomycetaceae bacterium]